MEDIMGKATLQKKIILRKFENVYESLFGFRLQIERVNGLSMQQKYMNHYVVC
jgi:hypothetical protein